MFLFYLVLDRCTGSHRTCSYSSLLVLPGHAGVEVIHLSKLAPATLRSSVDETIL